MEKTRKIATPIAKGVGPINDDAQPCESVHDMMVAICLSRQFL